MLIMDRDRCFWTDFIALYKNLTSLWRRGSKEYADKCLKTEQYEQLVAKLRERYPKADRQTAIRKINSLRTNYRREKRMLDIHRRSGERSSSTLWCFHLLSFLDESLHWKGSQDTYEEEESVNVNTDSYNIELYDEMLVDSDSESDEADLENNHTFWRQFIETYESLPSLWNKSSAKFGDRQQQSRDYKVLVDKLREVYPRAASKDMVKRKINNFRCAFRREYQKVLDSESSMLTYVPKLWYYNLLFFLSEHQESGDDLTAEEEACQKYFQAIEIPYEPIETPTESPTSTRKEKPINSSPMEDSIALSWSAQYKEMDGHQKILARKMIADILFHGCLGNLNVELTQAVQNVFNPQQS